MRKKHNLKVIIITLSIIFAFLSINIPNILNNQSVNRRNIESRDKINISGYWPNCPRIHINNDNWSATDLTWIQNNTGTYNDPHIIENVIIDAGNVGSCILIENSNEYFIVRNCTLINSGTSWPTAGLTLINTNNSLIFNNTCSFNGYSGIVLDHGFNNTVQKNTLNNNTYYGLGVGYSELNKILDNKAFNNRDGIIIHRCNAQFLTENIANNNWEHGINLNDCNNTIVLNNSAKYNGINGIKGGNCYSNNISKNIITYNGISGIDIFEFNNGFILENKILENGGAGIHLWTLDQNDYNSTISGNIVNKNGFGLYIYGHKYNTISENIINANEHDGIMISSSGNTIINNNISRNLESGIYLWRGLMESNDNLISKNTILFNYENGLSLLKAHENNISNNLINYNNKIGVKFERSNNNSIELNEIISNYGGIVMENSNYNNVSRNIINHNYQEGIFLLHSNYTTVIQNQIFGNEICILEFECEHNQIVDNECSVTSTDIFVDISNQSFNTESFNFTFLIYDGIGQGIDSATIMMWWNGTNISTDVQNLANGYYFVSLEALTVEFNEEPILLNMTISATGYQDKYFQTFVSVKPTEIVKLLNVEITESSYSLYHFNLTLLVYDETEQWIDSATIQMWWNGVDVSLDVDNLGNGLYFISLEPITVAPGEDPILLSMIISADGYEDTNFETYLGVDPDTLDKGIIHVEDPLIIIIIVITSIVGGVIVVSIILLRKKKRVS